MLQNKEYFLNLRVRTKKIVLDCPRSFDKHWTYRKLNYHLVVFVRSRNMQAKHQIQSYLLAVQILQIIVNRRLFTKCFAESSVISVISAVKSFFITSKHQSEYPLSNKVNISLQIVLSIFWIMSYFFKFNNSKSKFQPQNFFLTLFDFHNSMLHFSCRQVTAPALTY